MCRCCNVSLTNALLLLLGRNDIAERVSNIKGPLLRALMSSLGVRQCCWRKFAPKESLYSQVLCEKTGYTVYYTQNVSMSPRVSCTRFALLILPFKFDLAAVGYTTCACSRTDSCPTERAATRLAVWKEYYKKIGKHTHQFIAPSSFVWPNAKEVICVRVARSALSRLPGIDGNKPEGTAAPERSPMLVRKCSGNDL